MHDELRTISTIGGYVRLILRDCVVGQDWTDKQLRFLEEGLRVANRTERRLAAFHGMVDATTLSTAARAVADYYSGHERVRASIPDDAAEVSLPFAALPFALWLFVQQQPGIGRASWADHEPSLIALEVTLSESEVQVSVGPTQTRVDWSDETVRAAHVMDWVGDVNAMVKGSNGTFGIFTNTDDEMQMVMRWKREGEGVLTGLGVSDS